MIVIVLALGWRDGFDDGNADENGFIESMGDAGLSLILRPRVSLTHLAALSKAVATTKLRRIVSASPLHGSPQCQPLDSVSQHVSKLVSKLGNKNAISGKFHLRATIFPYLELKIANESGPQSCRSPFRPLRRWDYFPTKHQVLEGTVREWHNYGFSEFCCEYNPLLDT